MRNLICGQPQATRVSHTQGLAATHNGDSLEALVAHDGPAAVFAGHVPVVTVDRGKAYLVFASDAAGVDAELMACQVEHLLQGLLGLPGIFAKERTGVAEFHSIVADIEIDPARGPPLEHNSVISRVF